MYSDRIYLTPENAMGLNGYNIFASQLPLQGCAQRVSRSCHSPNNAAPGEAHKGISILFI